MKAACHTGAPKGKRVRVVLRNGQSFIAKFIERKSKYVVFDDRKILTKDLVSMTIVR